MYRFRPKISLFSIIWDQEWRKKEKDTFQFIFFFIMYSTIITDEICISFLFIFYINSKDNEGQETTLFKDQMSNTCFNTPKICINARITS